MIRYTLFSIFLLICSCSEKPPEAVSLPSTEESDNAQLSELIEQLFETTEEQDMRELLFFPNGMEVSKIDKITKQCLAISRHAKTSPQIQSVNIIGRWAKVELMIGAKVEITLVALKQEDQWQIFWDPSGSLMWGNQPWHSILTEDDMKDYKSLMHK